MKPAAFAYARPDTLAVASGRGCERPTTARGATVLLSSGGSGSPVRSAWNAERTAWKSAVN